MPQLLKISCFLFDAHFILLLAVPVTQKKQSCLFLCFLFPFLLLLTPKSVQLFGEVTRKVVKLPTITLVPAWKKLLPSQPDCPSQVPHQLLPHTEGTRQHCHFQKQCQLQVFLQWQTDGCSLYPLNSPLVWNTYVAFPFLSRWVPWLNPTSQARLSEGPNWSPWSAWVCAQGPTKFFVIPQYQTH